MKRQKAFFFIGIMISLFMGNVFAEAPVEEAGVAYQESAESSDTEQVEAPIVDLGSSTASATNNNEAAAVESTGGFSASDEQAPIQGLQNVTETEPLAETAAPLDTSAMSVEDRLRRLEQQMNNFVSMNMPQQLAEMQQQIAQTRGQLEIAEHHLQLLNKQLANFYQDLDSRISHKDAPTSVQTPDNSKSHSLRGASETSDASTNVSLQDARAYQAAFVLLTHRQYDQSHTALSTYLSQYPNGQYVADAHYWLGEIYSLNKDAKKAEAEFQTVIRQYPHSTKVADAKLKVAILHANAGQLKQAKAELLDIKKKNPNSTAAQLANIRLQQLEQENHS